MDVICAVIQISKDTREVTRAANHHILKAVWKFAKGQSGRYLDDFLGMATALKDKPSALEMMARMTKDGGCSSEERKEAILAAVRAFKWTAVKEAVMGLIAETAESDIGHVGGLAVALKERSHESSHLNNLTLH